MEQNASIIIRPPNPSDAITVNQLIAQSPPLDTNSLYCNLLTCTHFSATSAVAISGNNLMGFVSGYILPDEPNTLFIWQVAVHTEARGRKLGKQMVLEILKRPNCAHVDHLKTTITPDNQPSYGLFRSVSTELQAKMTKEEYFDQKTHFGGNHESEWLVKLGPFRSN